MKELEEEEEEVGREKRLGPGGLDPVEVYESLPKVTTQTHGQRHRFSADAPNRRRSVHKVRCFALVQFLLLQEIQRSFDEKNIQMLYEAMDKLHPEVSVCNRESQEEGK